MSRKPLAIAAMVVVTFTGACRREPADETTSAPVASTPVLEHRHDVRLTPAVSPLRARLATSFTVTVADTARPGEQPSLFEGAPLHVVIVNRELTFFEHRHPQPVGAAYQFSITFSHDDAYVAFVYYRLPDEQVEVTTFDLTVGAAPQHHRQPTVSPRTTRAGAYEVSLSMDPDPPQVPEWTELRLLLKHVARSASSSASGDHLVIIREGATAFVYGHSTRGEAQGGVRRQLHLPADPLHPSRNEDATVAGDDDRYHAQFPAPGKYKIWYEAPDGHVAMFVVDVPVSNRTTLPDKVR